MKSKLESIAQIKEDSKKEIEKLEENLIVKSKEQEEFHWYLSILKSQHETQMKEKESEISDTKGKLSAT